MKIHGVTVEEEIFSFLVIWGCLTHNRLIPGQGDLRLAPVYPELFEETSGRLGSRDVVN